MKNRKKYKDLRIITVKDAGRLFILDKLVDQKGSRNLRYFLESMLENFARIVKDYYKQVGDYQFSYKEKQMNSAMFPAIYEVADVVLMESPVIRRKTGKRYKKGRPRKKGEKTHGWVDYWANIGNTDFFLEVKHMWKGARTYETGKKMQKRWFDAVDQLKELRKKAIQDDVVGKHIVKMALLEVPTYSKGYEKENLAEVEEEELVDQFTSFFKQLRPKPKWAGLWVLHDNLQEEIKYKIGHYSKYEKYYSVMFFVYSKRVK